MGLQKVVFSKPSHYPLYYSIVATDSKSRTLMFHGSIQIKQQTGFTEGDWYDVYFDKIACVMQIQKTGVKSSSSRTMLRMTYKGRTVGGICFSFTAWPFEGFFPNGKKIPLEVLKAEQGVLLFRVPVDVKKGK